MAKTIPLRGKHRHGECLAECSCVECRAAFSPRERYDAQVAISEALVLAQANRLATALRDAKRVARLDAKAAPKATSGVTLARRTKAGEVRFYKVAK